MCPEPFDGVVPTGANIVLLLLLVLRVFVCTCAHTVWWHVFAGTAFVVLLPAIAPTHQSARWVFTTFAPDKAYSGIDSNAMLFLLSLLGSQWAMGELLCLSVCQAVRP